MLWKGMNSEADLLVPDCEDSVPLDQKQKAREVIKEELMNMTVNFKGPIYPRVNDLSTGLFEDDFHGVVDPVTLKAIDGICVPKVNNKEDVREINQFLSAQEKELNVE
jgi:citrate lyase beta subunit